MVVSPINRETLKLVGPSAVPWAGVSETQAGKRQLFEHSLAESVAKTFFLQWCSGFWLPLGPRFRCNEFGMGSPGCCAHGNPSYEAEVGNWTGVLYPRVPIPFLMCVINSRGLGISPASQPSSQKLS